MLDKLTKLGGGARHKEVGAVLAVVALLASGCSLIRQEREPYTTARDKTKKGAGIGAAAGAAGALLSGKREGDEILAGAAAGAAAGAGVGWYLDRQEEKLARIPGTTVERVGRNALLVHFDSDVLFDVDSASIDGGGRAALAEVASVLNEYPKTAVVVQGHTDASGPEAYNQELSERRADAVRAMLIARGVDGGRISAVGFGESDPIAGNDSAWGRQQNRRVDILLRARVT